jgi:hypothetical protein
MSAMALRADVASAGNPPPRQAGEDDSPASPIIPPKEDSKEDTDTIVLDDRFLDFSREISAIVMAWSVLLGTSALLDFFAATVDSHVRDYAGFQTDSLDMWLRENSFEFGMFFSVLWFFDAFVTARQSRRRSLHEADKARLLREDGWEQRAKHAKWKAYVDFFGRIVRQLLLLPVGFYVMGLDRGYGVEEVRVTHAHKVGVEDFDETETYSKYAHASLIFAIFHYAAVESSELLREKAVHHGKKSVFRWLRKSMRHPVKFARFVTKVTRWVRWIKIIGPVIGTSNKLLGNTVDLVKRIRQRRIARTAARLRSVLWNEMSEEELREHAAILIQKTYRAMRSRKAISALQLIKGDARRLAASRLQAHFRAALGRARAGIRRKQVELQRLARIAKEQSKKREKMSDSERRRMYSLQKELASDAKKLVNQELLLRPNTTFAVTWKTIFVAAVVLELSTLIALINWPELTKESLFPIPFSELEECQVTEVGPLRKFLSVLNRNNGEPLPWYCEEDTVALQSFGLASLRILMAIVLFAADFIFFFDVPVTFFTGRFNPNNGVLEPMPTFVRWVAPGVLLQLALNPKMDRVAENLAQVVSSIRLLGPIRVFRWTVATFFPLFLLTVQYMSRVWLRFVDQQNRTVRRQGQQD